jgi:PAS domain S-box-containing protein
MVPRRLLTRSLLLQAMNRVPTLFPAQPQHGFERKQQVFLEEAQPEEKTQSEDGAAMTRSNSRLGWLLCLGGASVGLIALAGWLTGVEQFAILIPGLPPMMPNTAICMAALGIAGALRRQENAKGARFVFSAVLAITVFAIGIGTIAEFALHFRFALDQFFIRTIAQILGSYPGRPSAPTALALTLLAAAILLFNSRLSERIRPSEWLILAAAVIAFTALIGQLFGAEALYRLARTSVIGISLPTVIGVFFISAGLLLERSDAGMMRIFAGSGPGSELLLRLAPPAILASTAFGLIAVRFLELPGIANIAWDIAIVFAVLTVVTSFASLFLISVTAIRLNKAHDALECAEARTRALFEQASDGIFIADLDGRYIDVNDAGCRMLGFSRDEVIGTTIMDVIMSEDLERLQATKTRLLAGGAEFGEWTLRHKDGTLIPTEVSANILPDGRWQAFVRDISARKRAEDALRLSEAKFSGIVSLAADAIISIDADRRITLFNKGAERVFGWSSTEMLGKPLDMLIPERFRAAHRRHVEDFVSGGSTTRRAGKRGAAIYGLRCSGEEFPVDASILRLSVGGTSILTVSLRDITEQKRAEMEQRLLAEMGSVLSTIDFEDALTNIAQLAVHDLADICIIDLVEADGKMRRARVACRDPAYALVSEEIMGRENVEKRRSPIAMGEICQPLLVEEVTTSVLRSWLSGESEVKAVQSTRPGSAMLVPLQAHEKHLGLLLLISSGSSRKFAWRDLWLAQAIAQRAALSIENALLYRTAMHATRDRDEMLGIVAHDLGNPLQVISTNAALLRRDASEETSQSGDEIGHAVNRMNRLIQDLLDVTGMEAGHLSLRPERLAVPEFITDLLDAQGALASSAALELRAVLPPDLPDVWADRDRLNQIFENLIGNAIKFSKSDGRITLGAQVEQNQIVFSVADTGAGIAEADFEHIFDRFWQVPKAKRRGAGLGLPIVKGLVQAHGGSVWVQSTVGKGSTFFFTIPMAAQAGGVREDNEIPKLAPACRATAA